MRQAHTFKAEVVRDGDRAVLSAPITGWFRPALTVGDPVAPETFLGELQVLAWAHRLVAPAGVWGVVAEIDLAHRIVDLWGTLLVIELRSPPTPPS